MCAITVPFTIVWMSAFENSIPNARPAAPSAKIPDSASASEVTSPEATMFAVLRASIARALGDRDGGVRLGVRQRQGERDLLRARVRRALDRPVGRRAHRSRCARARRDDRRRASLHHDTGLDVDGRVREGVRDADAEEAPRGGAARVGAGGRVHAERVAAEQLRVLPDRDRRGRVLDEHLDRQRRQTLHEPGQRADQEVVATPCCAPSTSARLLSSACAIR